MEAPAYPSSENLSQASVHVANDCSDATFGCLDATSGCLDATSGCLDATSEYWDATFDSKGAIFDWTDATFGWLDVRSEDWDVLFGLMDVTVARWLCASACVVGGWVGVGAGGELLRRRGSYCSYQSVAELSES